MWIFWSSVVSVFNFAFKFARRVPKDLTHGQSDAIHAGCDLVDPRRGANKLDVVRAILRRCRKLHDSVARVEPDHALPDGLPQKVVALVEFLTSGFGRSSHTRARIFATTTQAKP